MGRFFIMFKDPQLPYNISLGVGDKAQRSPFYHLFLIYSDNCGVSDFLRVHLISQPGF